MCRSRVHDAPIDTCWLERRLTGAVSDRSRRAGRGRAGRRRSGPSRRRSTRVATPPPTRAVPPAGDRRSTTATWVRVRGPPWVPRSVPISSNPKARPGDDHARQHSSAGSATWNGAVPSTPSTSASHARAVVRAGAADHGRAALGEREQVEAAPGELGAEVDRRSVVERLLVVVGHDDPHRVVPVERARGSAGGARRWRGSTASAASLSGPYTCAAVSGALSWLTSRSGRAAAAATSSTMVSRSST